ncbi:hypothetical protein [Actinopolyspora mortivallis]|uniref:Uncharacterized protein n=1 Tax=Actinopolyspora mortivallis TaxID=33906 RepID=A0A2T0GZA2_ACTMO|nr:hypothetical protein [Actinopolyspora mortivallis]PRW64439.1 hypothetical protein CEP50_05865 [Actinopolyspora mortivallis]
MSPFWLLLRAHHWPLYLLGCAGTALVHTLFGAERLPVPVPNVGSLDVPLGLFSPLLLACLLVLHLRPPTRLWDTAPRAHGVIRLGLLGTAILPAALACLPLWTHSPQLALSALRNLAGLTGIALATATVAGATRGWMSAFPYVLLVLLLGTHGHSTTGGYADHPWWAFPLEPAGDVAAVALVVLVFGAATVSYALRGARPEW